jgi:hypothetical protein
LFKAKACQQLLHLLAFLLHTTFSSTSLLPSIGGQIHLVAMDRTSGVLRKQPVQPQAPPVAATNASTRVTRPVQPSTTASPTHPEPQMEASNGVPLGDKAMSRKRAATAEIPPRPTKAKAGSHLTVTRATSPLPNRDDELLKLLKAEFETLRSLVTCGICFGLLYEPYTTPCGHTFCYNCLCKSFTEERNGVKVSRI